MDEATKKLAVEQKPELMVLGAVRVTRDGKEVGKVDALFDFKDLPKEFHALVADVIIHSGVNITLAV